MPPELWDRLGTRLIPKLKQGKGVTVRVEFSVIVDASGAAATEAEIRSALNDLGLAGQVTIEAM